MKWDILWTDANLASFDPVNPAPYGHIKDGAIAAKDGVITWIGPQDMLPAAPAALANIVLPQNGRWITPGLVDCHTHLIFGGHRAGEFERRLSGASYAEIARSGGGILSTVRDTRAASAETLYRSAARRLDDMKRGGVTTVEIKSGYGLTKHDEFKMLRVARALENEGVRVSATFLGAHAFPPEYEDRPDDYIDHIITDMLPVIAAKKLADSIDVFCENIGFTYAQTKRLFEAARALSLPLRLHAEQLTDMKGAVLAAKYGALSADHLEYLAPQDASLLAAAGTVAVLLPGAFYTLGETKLPPIEALREAGAQIALASDCNPGTSPITSPLTVLNMGCTIFGLTPHEALRAMTLGGARALGLEDKIGSLQIGKQADLAIWDIEHPAELAYWMGTRPLYQRVLGGKIMAVQDEREAW